jgi:hypothetical protein
MPDLGLSKKKGISYRIANVMVRQHINIEMMDPILT